MDEGLSQVSPGRRYHKVTLHLTQYPIPILLANFYNTSSLSTYFKKNSYYFILENKNTNDTLFVVSKNKQQQQLVVSPTSYLFCFLFLDSAKTCKGPNEEYTNCKRTCPPETCLSLNAKFKCYSKEPCQPGCACKSGFLRKKADSPCVPICECDQLKDSTDCKKE